MRYFKKIVNLFCIAALSVALYSCKDDKDEDGPDDNGLQGTPELMEEATIYSGPENSGDYSEAQTKLTLMWKGHSLSFSPVFNYPPHIYIQNISEEDSQKVAVYEIELTSLEDGGLNGVNLDFSNAGVTQKKNDTDGSYEIVYGEFEITIPMGMVESASVTFNPEQKIKFTQSPSKQ